MFIELNEENLKKVDVGQYFAYEKEKKTEEGKRLYRVGMRVSLNMMIPVIASGFFSTKEEAIEEVKKLEKNKKRRRCLPG